MTPILIGWDARGRPVELGPEERESTHMHVIGGSGTGKSKFLEWMVRRDVREGHGVCVIDWHGTLYNDLLRYFAYQDVGRPGDDRSVVLVNPSQPDFVSGFNPFLRSEGDISVQVSRRVDATIRPWGVTDTNETPTFARLCRVLYTFMVENAETLPNASLLLQFKNTVLRAYAAEHVSDSMMRAEWEELLAITKADRWKDEVLSTKNRLVRFIGSKTVRRFMGLPAGRRCYGAYRTLKVYLCNFPRPLVELEAATPFLPPPAAKSRCADSWISCETISCRNRRFFAPRRGRMMAGIGPASRQQPGRNQSRPRCLQRLLWSDGVAPSGGAITGACNSLQKRTVANHRHIKPKAPTAPGRGGHAAAIWRAAQFIA